MELDLEKIMHEALNLPPELRAVLACQLLESLDDEIDEDAEAAWSAEIVKRLREIKTGKIQTIPWAQARVQIHGGKNVSSKG